MTGICTRSLMNAALMGNKGKTQIQLNEINRLYGLFLFFKNEDEVTGHTGGR